MSLTQAPHMSMQTHYLRQALQLATIRRGFCAPNPSVGAVIIKDNEVIAEGYHWASGYPHAEAEAINKIGGLAKDTTLYVTLEPCCHKHKKTPPCTELLIHYGIKRVVYAFRDPNPAVAGKSESVLTAAGIECEHFPLPEINAFYKSYAHWWQTQTPFITAKLAISLDAKIAGIKGERLHITGKGSQQFTHQQRKLADAILTTAKTIALDDPLLNVRLENEIVKKPIYILDSDLNTVMSANIFSSAEKITLFHKKNVTQNKINLLTQHNVRCIAVEQNEEYLNLKQVIQTIGADGIHDLWVEAGGTCFSSLIKHLMLQRAYIYIAPKLLGKNAQSAFETTQNLFASVKQFHWQQLEQDAICEMHW